MPNTDVQTGAEAALAEDDPASVGSARETRFDECFREYYRRGIVSSTHSVP